MAKFISYNPQQFDESEMLERSRSFYELMNRRRTVRDFSDRPVSREIMENIIKTASTAPSGANKQPWTFCLISDPVIKKQIREAAEREERINYGGRMSKEWLEDLSYLGTDEHKPFLEIAPWLIVVFKQSYGLVNGEKKNHYYVVESVGLACGMLLAAIHNAGLVAVTHTPSPMIFLSKILNRPPNEKPFLLIPVGFPAAHVEVPDIRRKGFDDICLFY